MKKVLPFLLAAFLAVTFFSCEEAGITLDEDYVGIWYIYDNFENEYTRMAATDTVFVNSKRNIEVQTYANDVKGTITSTGDTTFTVLVTDSWDSDTDSWVELDPPETMYCTYSLSSDKSVLTVNDGETTSKYYSTEAAAYSNTYVPLS